MATKIKGTGIAAGAIDSANIGNLSGHLNLLDSQKIRFGNDQDLNIYHDASNSYISDTGTGALYIKTNYLAIAASNGEQMINAEQNAAVELYHNNAKKLETTSTGIDVTGNVVVGGTVDGIDIATRDAVLTSTTTAANAAAPLASPTLTGTPAAPTASGSTSTTQLATTAFVQQELTTLIGGAPSTLNDLNELAAAINDDANYNSTLTTALGTKLPLAGGTMTGNIAHAGNFTLDVGGDITLDAGGSSIHLHNGGTDYGQIHLSSNNIDFHSEISNGDIRFFGNDGGTPITALILDMSEGGAATFNNDIYLKDGRAARFGNDQDFRIYNDGSHTYLHNTTVNQDIIIKGNDDGSPITALTFDMSVGANATFGGNIAVTKTSGWAEMHLNGASGGDLIFLDNGVSYGEIYAGNGHGMVLKSYASQDMYFLTNADATAKLTIKSAGNVGIGTTAPAAKLEVKGLNSSSTADWGNKTIMSSVAINAANRTYGALILKDHGTSGDHAGIGFRYDGTGYKLEFATAATTNSGITTHLTIDRAGAVTTSNHLTVGGDITQTSGDLLYSNNINWDIKHLGAGQNIVISTTPTGGSATDRMRIQTNGNIGVGDTPSANNKFRIKGNVIGTAANLAESAQLAILSLNYPRGNVNSGIHFGYANANYIQAADDSGSNAKNLTLNPFGGNVGIGTASPASLLDVGGGLIADPAIRIDSASGGSPYLIFDASQANRSAHIKFYDNGSAVGGFIDYLHNGDKMNFGSGSSSGVTMTVGDGKVGIGTTNPDSKLEVVTNSTSIDYTLRLKNTNTTDDNGTAVLFQGKDTSGNDVSYGALKFKYTNHVTEKSQFELWHMNNSGVPTQALTLDHDGMFGIGTTNPAQPLDVVGNMRSSTGLYLNNSSGGFLWNQANGHIAFGTNNIERMRLGTTGALELGYAGAARQQADGQAFTITTPASGGGQGIALKRLDSNSDQGLGEISWSNNTQDGLADIMVKTAGAVNTTDMHFKVASGGAAKEGIRINGSHNANVGIGDVDPTTARLQVRGQGGGSGVTFRTQDVSNNETFWINDGGAVGVRYWPFHVGKASGHGQTGAYAPSGERIMSQGPVGSGFEGRHVHNWWGPRMSGNAAAYYHLRTSMWGGGSPSGNIHYIMGGFKIIGYRYGGNANHYSIHQFHNWSAALHNYTKTELGPWTGASHVYVDSTGYVTIRLEQGSYKMFTIDFIQYNQYTKRGVTVTAETSSSTAEL